MIKYGKIDHQIITFTFVRMNGFISSGFLNLSGSEAYKEATENGAIIVDVREDRLTGYKCFDVPKVIINFNIY